MSLLTISPSPHFKGSWTVERAMWTVNIALVPAVLVYIFFFGWSALATVAVALIGAVVAEFLIQKFLLKASLTVFDGSAVITGLLIALNVPATLPWWMTFLGSLFAIAIVKMPFGGLGRNIFNPALAARAFLLASFPVAMTQWPTPGGNVWTLGSDVVTYATPLSALKEGGVQTVAQFWNRYGMSDISSFYPEIMGGAILLGGLALLFTKVIRWHIPVLYMGSLALVSTLFWIFNPTGSPDPLFSLLSGGVLLGAWFMATDYSSSPMSLKGQIVYALSAGILCGLIRALGSYPDGVAYSILILNALTPLINKYLKPGVYGRRTNYVV